MPEKELLVEFNQIISLVVLMGAAATVLFAILHWLLKKWIFRKARAAG